MFVIGSYISDRPLLDKILRYDFPCGFVNKTDLTVRYYTSKLHQHVEGSRATQRADSLARAQPVAVSWKAPERWPLRPG